VGQERLGPSYFFISLVLGPLNSLVWYVPSLRYTRGLGWRMHCCVEVTESSTNKQHRLSMENAVAYASCGAWGLTRPGRGMWPVWPVSGLRIASSARFLSNSCYESHPVFMCKTCRGFPIFYRP
jgi:hypothetical protein